MKTLIFLLILTASVWGQEIIEITVKGISDKQNDGAQKDRQEAILDAKRQACEKAGLTIESKTTVENFEVVYDFVETKAATVLLPGFQLMDIGYVQDGTYQVVLTGKIKVMAEEEKISAKELRYAKSLRDRGKHNECEKILTKYIDSEDKDVSEALKEEAFYYFIKWGYAWDVMESFNKFAAYYPDSKYLSTLEAFANFAVEPLHKHKQDYSATNDQWQDAEYTFEKITYTRVLKVLDDTLVFTNFRGKEQTLLTSYDLYSDGREIPATAFRFRVRFYDGNLRNAGPQTELKDIIDNTNDYRPDSGPTFQYSSNGKWFGHYRIKWYNIKGDLPKGEGPFTAHIEYELYQPSF